ncbi:MAG: copper-translocating P-type ATPase [Chloroflexi bacterium 13_1_20CM_54_36]|nr:MAG: copper-translocating P-type ATPase [Chloroflexi bacterium 13_1_20CM_54_36]
MTAPPETLCRHCLLPVGRRGFARTVNGESCQFCCYGCCIAHQVKSGSGDASEAAWFLVRLGVGSFLSMNIMLFSLLVYSGAFTGADRRVLPTIHLLLWGLATPAVLILGEPFVRETWSQVRRGRLSSSALIVLGTLAAYTYSTLAVFRLGGHLYFDTASMVLMLFTLGRYLEAAGRARASRDLAPLLAAESESATVVEGAEEHRRPVREVRAGMLIRVKPGERIPVDGLIVEGRSHTDDSVINGESRQSAKAVGGSVLAGSINLDGPLLIRSSGSGDESRWAQICRSVRDALRQSSRTQRIADRVGGAFVPVVLALAGMTLAYWAQRLPLDQAMLVALSVLVVACPCAVGLAAPMAHSLGIGQLARHGCLVRSPGALEALALTRLIAFDKTGTLTTGWPHLVDLASDGVGGDEVLARLAGLERHSEHGLARAIAFAARARGLVPIATDDVRIVPGRGLRGVVHGELVAAGSATLMRDLGWQLPPALVERADVMATSGHSVVLIGWSEKACVGRARAALSFDDTPLPEARATIDALRGLGLRVMLLTGDNAGAAARVAATVGVDDWQAGLLPQAKRIALDQCRPRHGAVAMVGDGLNDGPGLAWADVGIAVGSATDLARETADLVLPPGGLWLLPWVVGRARAVRSTILTNLAWAFGYNLVALTCAVLGLLQPILAAAVMAGSSLLVVLNSLRLERLPEPCYPGVAALPAASQPECELSPGEQGRSTTLGLGRSWSPALHADRSVGNALTR